MFQNQTESPANSMKNFEDIMEQHALKNANNCLNTYIYSYLETAGGQSSNPYLNVVNFFNNSLNYTSVAA